MTDDALRRENEQLRQRLQESEDTLRAIRSGGVDAVVVESPNDVRVYTLDGADRPYRILVEQMQQGAATLNENGTIAYCNLRFASLLGTPHERLIGADFHDFIPAEEQANCHDLLQQGLTGSAQGETRLQPANIPEIPVILTVNVLPEDCGAALGLLVTDLTFQRHHERLNAALDALRESDRRKDEFLATLAHELRNPLAPIRSGLELMKMVRDDPDLIEEVRSTMERQTLQMVHLIDDLLDVSRITQGKLQLRRCRVELKDVVQSAVEATRPFIDEAGHELRIDLPESAVFLQADATRLAQVLSNLLNNAAKYTKEPGLIQLRAELEGPLVAISVVDTGLGIPADMQERIFEMFGQIDRTVEGGYAGLGIGLTLVKSLVEMHGGSVTVFSEGANRGSRFTVSLPLIPDSLAAPGLPDVQRSGDGSSSNLRILLVDDNRAAVQMLEMVVRMFGNTVHVAYDGEEAVAAAEIFRPDVILMDIGMPKLDGYAAARRIRETEWGRSIVLVALTGWGHEDDKQRSREAGFDHHLVKPAEPAALQEIFAAMNVQ